jgi:hypothetical protein
MIAEMNNRNETFRRRMQEIQNFMQDYRIPKSLQERVKSCFQFLAVRIEPHTLIVLFL